MQQQTGIDDIADDAILFSRFGQAIFAYVRLYTSSREDAEDLGATIHLSWHRQYPDQPSIWHWIQLIRDLRSKRVL